MTQPLVFLEKDSRRNYLGNLIIENHCEIKRQVSKAVFQTWLLGYKITLMAVKKGFV